MKTLTVKTRLLSAFNQRYPREKEFSMEINLTNNKARIRYKGAWYQVETWRLLDAERGRYEATLAKPLPGNVYATQYAFLAGAPWQGFEEDPTGKPVLVTHRNRDKRMSSSIIFWTKQGGKRVRKRVYGRVVETADKRTFFVPRVKEAV